MSNDSARPYRVLFVAHSANRGGAEYCLDTTLRHLDRNRFEPLVVFPFDGPMVQSARSMNIEVSVTSMCHWLYFEKSLWFWRNLLGRSLGNISRFTRLIRQREIDLVYTNTSAIFEAAISARRARVPHLWHVHEVLRPGNQMSQLVPIRWMQRYIAKYSDQVVFESHAARDAFETTTKLPNAEVVYNSLRLESPPKNIDVSAKLIELGICEAVPVIVFLGQFIDRKNPLLLIDAMAQVAKNAKVRCLLFGQGSLEGELRQRIRQLDLERVCTIHPFQEDIAKIMALADMLVLPSRQESFGLVLVEAGAFGKPVIACESQGPNEIIVDGQTGLLVPQDDIQGLAQAIEALLGSTELARSLGHAGRQRAEQLFSPHKNTAQLELLMTRLIQSSCGSIQL